MSTSIRVQKICEYCGRNFTAKTTKTRYCSHKCNSRDYKARKRAVKVAHSNRATIQITTLPIEELKAKEFLTISETCKLLSISRWTIWRLIRNNDLQAFNIGRRKLIKRSDIDKLLVRPTRPTPRKEPEPVTEFYTVKEIEEKYFIKYGRLNTIIKKKDIPKTVYDGKLHVSKPHIDRYFKRTRNNVNHISDWYTVQEIQKKYGLSRDQVYGRVSDNNLPKKRMGKYVKISKQHFDELFELGV